MNTKRITAAALAVLLAASAALGMTSCQKKEAEPKKEKRTNVYETVMTTPLPDGVNYVQRSIMKDDCVYLMYRTVFTYTYDADGNVIKKEAGYHWDDSYYIDYSELEEWEEEPILYVTDVADDLDIAAEEPVPAAEEPESSSKVAAGGAVWIETTGPGEEPLPGGAADNPGGWQNILEQLCIAKVSLEDGSLTEYEIDTGEGDAYFYPNSFGIGKDGRILFVHTLYDWNEETGESTNTVYLKEYDPVKKQWAEQIELNPELEKAGVDLLNFYVNDCFYSDDGSIYINGGENVYVFDGEGHYRSTIDCGGNWVNVMLSAGNRILIGAYDEGGMEMSSRPVLTVYENGKGTEIKSESLKASAYGNYTPSAFDGERLYYTTATGVGAYDMTDDSAKEIMNYINSDLDSNSVNVLGVTKDGKILAADYGNSYIYSSYAAGVSGEDENRMKVFLLQRVPDEKLQEEVIVKLGCVYPDYELTKAIISFNKKNTGVRISVVSYDGYNNEENQWTGAVTKMNSEIVSGTAPDMILLSSEMPVDSYMQKGVFADLTPYMKDEETGISRSDYLENILDATVVDGKQYSIILQFSLRTLFAKSKYVGETPGWTFDEMMQAIRSMPEGMSAFYGSSRDTIINSFFMYTMPCFVDWRTGQNKFDTEAFREFIKYLASVPEKGIWDSEDPMEEWDEDKYREREENYQLRYWRDYGLFDESYMYDFTGTLNMTREFATEEITPIGYPTDDGCGAIIVPSTEIAVMQRSGVKKQAWEIIRAFITDQSLTSNSWGFSINRSIMEDQMKEQVKQYQENYKNGWYGYTDDDWEWMRESGYSDDYIEFQKQQYRILDEKMAQEVMDLVKSANVVFRSDKDLLEIVTEELSAFFGGSRSAEETARVIASRARVYMSTNS